jgi:hypothetical protein
LPKIHPSSVEEGWRAKRRGGVEQVFRGGDDIGRATGFSTACKAPPEGTWEHLPRSDFRILQREQGFAGGAHILRWWTSIANGEDPRFVAPRTGGRGGAGIGVGRNFKVLRDFPHPRCFQLKGGVAMVANVVVAALRLARVKHIGRPALRADHRNRLERHEVSSMAKTRLPGTGYRLQHISLSRLLPCYL